MWPMKNVAQYENFRKQPRIISFEEGTLIDNEHKFWN